MTQHVLCVRLDNAGDVLLAGPAIRAVADSAAAVTVLAGPAGADAARLLPGVNDVIEWRCPWIDLDQPKVDPGDLALLKVQLLMRGIDAALIFTSFHQSALPTALVLRTADVGWVGAISQDYPGALLDLRHRVDEDQPEAERALSLAEAAGYRLPDGDDGALRVRGPLPDVGRLTGDTPYVVLHPGTSAPARAWPAERYAEAAKLLQAAGYRVVVTGTANETALTCTVSVGDAVDLGGRTTFSELAAVLAGADAVVVGNTGPAHLAAAVRTPVVSLFAPTVPAVRWAPYGVPAVLLGDQNAPCRDTRAVSCPVPGHPCLSSVTADEVVDAVENLNENPERVQI
ncbi:glycosyltransferase family 9 protein [Phytoactinopolyspora halotolerans]|uniref:Glycosyltransferase family 9 protein n=1 Tax=Phytoactinopolyspora halotolerans TaxID=1981512 RepID=A0A6L9SAN4_9ACTN|nr:glycosyltransferase family 9 protein [Phytoactinopolyspora halotolerans]NEE02316.1 glycosyltransferase family 9 protein [Phytoactinopolyspora halotolerans]